MANRQNIKEMIETFLEGFDRSKWIRLQLERDPDIESEEDWDRAWEGEVFDPDGVRENSTRLDVCEEWSDWDCVEGWSAYRYGRLLYCRWYRNGWGQRTDRDLWVRVGVLEDENEEEEKEDNENDGDEEKEDNENDGDEDEDEDELRVCARIPQIDGGVRYWGCRGECRGHSPDAIVDILPDGSLKFVRGDRGFIVTCEVILADCDEADE